MSKKKVNKGTKIDLSQLTTAGGPTASLPQGPAERAEGDEGRFQRHRGGRGGKGYDRDGGYDRFGPPAVSGIP